MYLAAHFYLEPAFSACQQNQTLWQVSSPNGNIMVEVKLDPVTGTVTYDALLHTESNTITALERSTLGRVREDMDFSENLRFHAFREQSINEPYSVISGKRINDVNHCNDNTWRLYDCGDCRISI